MIMSKGEEERKGNRNRGKENGGTVWVTLWVNMKVTVDDKMRPRSHQSHTLYTMSAFSSTNTHFDQSRLSASLNGQHSHGHASAVVTDGQGAKELNGHKGRLTLRREGLHQVFGEGETNNG